MNNAGRLLLHFTRFCKTGKSLSSQAMETLVLLLSSMAYFLHNVVENAWT
jgi:hypothetical protein